MAVRKTLKRPLPASQVNLSIAADTRFDDLVAILKQTLTVPELPGFRGCRPCLSGLDRLVIEDIVLRGIR